MQSLENGLWQVQLAGGELEAFTPRVLRKEGDPTPETLEMVEAFKRTR